MMPPRNALAQSLAIRLSGLVLLAGMTGIAVAQETPAQEVKRHLEAALKNVEVVGVQDSPVSGLHEVTLSNGSLLYAMDGGRYVLQGELFSVSDQGSLVNLTEQHRQIIRQEQMATVPLDEMIVFAPEQSPAKAQVYVFTDVDCGYCREFHRHMAQFNAMGIEVRYMAFPRQGPASATGHKMITAWCADNPQDAMTRLKAGENLPLRSCLGHPVARHYELGRQLGIRGTPSMVVANGMLIQGYLPPVQLAQALGLEP